MRDVTPIEKTILEKESETIGGMVVMIWGEQGSGKTMTLTKMVMKDMGIEDVGDDFDAEKAKRIPLWKGQKSCQWLLLAANDLPITLWMHESINDFQFLLTGSKSKGLDKRYVDITELDGLDVNIETYETQEELVEKLDPNRVNVYYIPGAKGTQKDKYFYQFQNYKLDKALNERDYGDHVTLNRDEVSNEASTMRKGDFYELQEFLFPQEWEDFRKNKISKRGTGHSTSDVNYKLHKVKCTGTVYMQGAQVHSRHTKVNQGSVNSMERGQFVIPGFDPGVIKPMPRLPHDVFDWMPETNDVRLKMSYEASIPDVRPKEKDVEEWIDSQPFSKDDLDDLIDLNEAVKVTGLGKTALKTRIYNGEVDAVKVNNSHWIMSLTSLLNNEKVPIEAG